MKSNGHEGSSDSSGEERGERERRRRERGTRSGKRGGPTSTYPRTSLHPTSTKDLPVPIDLPKKWWHTGPLSAWYWPIGKVLLQQQNVLIRPWDERRELPVKVRHSGKSHIVLDLSWRGIVLRDMLRHAGYFPSTEI